MRVNTNINLPRSLVNEATLVFDLNGSEVFQSAVCPGNVDILFSKYLLICVSLGMCVLKCVVYEQRALQKQLENACVRACFRVNSNFRFTVGISNLFFLLSKQHGNHDILARGITGIHQRVA